MYNYFSINFIYPIGDLIFGSSITKYYKQLEKTQWLSLEQLQEFQNRKLQMLIKHAFQNVPYYNQLFNNINLKCNDIKTISDLKKIPLLKKDNIRSNYDKIKAKNIYEYKPILNQTGGSTGEPLQYYITKDVASITWAGMFRGWGWAGYKIGDKRITFGGSSLVPDAKASLFQRLRQLLERNLPLSAVSMTEQKYEHYISIIRKYKPKFLKGYPSSIFLLADFCKDHNINDIKFKAVFSTSEVLLPHYRQLIEKQFQCKVFDEYGSYDGGGQALECEFHTGFHISVEKVIMEITDDNGIPVPPGKPGHIVVTDLHNYAMPFIRYDVGDIGIMDDKPCPCGRSLPLLKEIHGRTTDIIKLSNGVSIAGPAVTLIFKDCHVKQYQLVQISGNEILVKVVKGENFSEKDENHFMNILKHHVGKDIKVNIEYCSAISLNNKYRFIISNI